MCVEVRGSEVLMFASAQAGGSEGQLVQFSCALSGHFGPIKSWRPGSPDALLAWRGLPSADPGAVCRDVLNICQEAKERVQAQLKGSQL